MPPVAAPAPAPRIHANVRRLVCDAPVERAMLNSLRAQGSVNVTYALDKTKKDFIKAARPLVGAPPTVPPQTWGTHQVTQQVVWDCLEVFSPATRNVERR